MKLKSLLTLGIALPLTAQAASLLTGGHIDGPAFGYVSNADVVLDPLLTQGFEPHFHKEGGANGAVVDGVVQVDESEFEPGDLIVVVPELSVTTLNSTSYFWLPETEQAAATNGTPFLGIGLEFEISGTHVDDGLQSASAVYSFQVVPEPTTAMLGALGSLALLRRRR